jgi:hypothetical protein
MPGEARSAAQGQEMCGLIEEPHTAHDYFVSDIKHRCPGDFANATAEDLRAALIFWVSRCRRFEEKLDQFSYMKARGVVTDEFALGNRIFEESLPTVEDLVGLVPDMNPESE